MELRIFSPTWGMKEPDLEVQLRRIKEAGFDGVEMGATKYSTEPSQIKQLLQKYELLCIAQIWTAGPSVEQHMQSLEEQVSYNKQMGPLFINAQTGKDFFTITDNLKLLRHAEGVSAKHGIPVYHETHRGRFSFAAQSTFVYLQQLESLTLTADFSHWCCVSESLLADQEYAMKEALRRANHIHARVGYAEGPQVTDPRAAEWNSALQAHLGWWDVIVREARSRKQSIMTITPEFGPAAAGYLHTLPFTNMPVADQWEINCYMKDMLRDRYT